MELISKFGILFDVIKNEKLYKFRPKFNAYEVFATLIQYLT